MVFCPMKICLWRGGYQAYRTVSIHVQLVGKLGFVVEAIRHIYSRCRCAVVALESGSKGID